MNFDKSIPQALIDEFVAAAHGDIRKVKQLLAEHPDLVNANASWHELPIEAASQTGSVEIVEFLLASGAPLDICSAVMLGEINQIEKLLIANPNLILTKGAHDLPLMYFAAIRGHQEIANYLLERGAEVDAGNGGNTALHGAVLFGQVDMVTWLLANGANVKVLDFNGKTPLQLAEQNQQTTISELLKQAQ